MEAHTCKITHDLRLIGSASLYKKKRLNIIYLPSFVKMLPRDFLAIQISRQYDSISSVPNAL